MKPSMSLLCSPVNDKINVQAVFPYLDFQCVSSSLMASSYPVNVAVQIHISFCCCFGSVVQRAVLHSEVTFLSRYLLG